MVSISFTRFRQNAKTYFDAVGRGEIVRVLRRGKVIAEIVPPAQKRKHYTQQNKQFVIPGVSLSRIILEEREKN